MQSSEPRKPQRPASRWLTTGIALCLAIITWLVFVQTVRYDFINYDDPTYVYQNTNVSRGLTIDSIRWAFTHIHAQNWHPLTTISHMLDCQLYGLKAGGHHFTNVLLHAVAVVLLFFVIRYLTGALWSSAFVAALFAIHPLRVESVAWIAERKDVLSAVFFMLTLGTYARYAHAPSFMRYLAVAALFAVALMCKPMVITVPFLLLLLDYWPLGRLAPATSGKSKQKERSRARRGPAWRQVVLEKIPLFFLSAASAVITFLAQRHAVGGTGELPMLSRINNALVSYVIYLWQMLWPAQLSVFYPHPENRLAFWQICLSLAVLISVTAAAVALRRRHPYFIVGWLWYLGMLVPVIGIVQAGWQGRADRYTYLPQIGLYIVVSWAATELTAFSHRQKAVLTAVSAFVLGILGWRAWIQTSYWRNSETLFRHALAVTPKNDVAENNLGIVLLGRGQVDDAIARFEKAVALRPENTPAHENLAKAYLQKGEVEKAMSHYYKMLEIDPQNVEAHNVVGTVLIQHGRVKEAVDQWQQTLARDPENGNAKNNLAWVFATCPHDSIRDGSKAVELAEQAWQLSGQLNPMVLRTLAAAYAENGRFAEAIDAAQRALELATRQGNSGLAADLQNNIMLYQSGKALRDPSLINGSSAF